MRMSRAEDTACFVKPAILPLTDETIAVIKGELARRRSAFDNQRSYCKVDAISNVRSVS